MLRSLVIAAAVSYGAATEMQSMMDELAATGAAVPRERSCPEELHADRGEFAAAVQRANAESSPSLVSEYATYACEFGKLAAYDREDEALLRTRLAAFEETKRRLAQYDVAAMTWTPGLTFSSDWTAGEKAAAIAPAEDADAHLAALASCQDYTYSSLPSTYQNWAASYSTPVKSQGNCGSCWAFAATAQFETNRNIYYSHSDAIFSEQYLIDCDDEENGCSGGWPPDVVTWVLDNYHCYESTYADYCACDNQACRDSSCWWSVASGAVCPTSGDADQLARAIYYNAVVVAFDFYETLWDYAGGWYDCATSSALHADASSKKSTGSHAVSMEGYSYNSWWLAKNSWGSDSGVFGGYIVFAWNAFTSCNIRSPAFNYWAYSSESITAADDLLADDAKLPPEVQESRRMARQFLSHKRGQEHETATSADGEAPASAQPWGAAWAAGGAAVLLLLGAGATAVYRRSGGKRDKPVEYAPLIPESE